MPKKAKSKKPPQRNRKAIPMDPIGNPPSFQPNPIDSQSSPTPPSRFRHLTSKLTNNNLPSRLRSKQLLPLLAFILLFAAVGSYLLISSKAAGNPIATLEAETMTIPAGASVLSDSTASASQAIKFTTNGTATGSVTIPVNATSLSVRAKGIQCKGSPQMVIKVNNTQVLTSSVSASNWSEAYTANLNLPASSHTVSITFTNDNQHHNCSRDLLVDKITFFGATTTTPAPTMSLTANPTSVATGATSTLTWNSTNASSCSASDGWTGTKPTSGSETTAAINANTTYTLSCSGAGGTGTANATVGISVATADPVPNCIGEPADHPPVNYPEQRVFLEAQGWWDDRDDDGQVARFGDSEHLHIGMCFPLQQTVSGTMRLDIRVVGHNLPAGSIINNTRFHDASSQTYENIQYDRTVQAGESNVTVWKRLDWNSAVAPDGLRETRFLTRVDRPDTAEIHASTGWCVNFQNGKTDENYDSCVGTNNRRLTEGRGWYDCLEYKISRFDSWTYPYGGIPSGQPYSLNVTGQDGAPFSGGGDDEVTRHWLRLDPNFHAGDLGTLVFEHAGAHRNETVTIPGEHLTPGVHYMFLMTERDAKCTQVSTDTAFPDQKVPQDGIISGGLRVPIKVNPS